MTTLDASATTELFTISSKINFLNSLFACRFTNQGKLMHPSQEWYSHSLTNSELEIIAKQICAWTGLKPRHFQVCYSNEIDGAGSYYEDKSGHHVAVSDYYKHKPYETVAIVTHEIIHYLLESTKQLDITDSTVKEELAELASINFGLGVLVVNGMNHYETWLQRSWAALWPHHNNLPIGINSPIEYARQLANYVGQSTVVSGSNLYSLLAPWSKRLFDNAELANHNSAPYVKQADQRIRKSNFSLTCMSLLILSFIVLSTFIVSQIPKTASIDIINRKESAELLYKQYVLCTQTVNNQVLNSANPDILTQQNINANISRCQSLKNQYNTKVDGYNEQLSK